MNLSYLNEQDWEEFSERFPSAESFLMERSLRHELEHLRHLKNLKPEVFRRLGTPVRQRLEVLETWDADMSLLLEKEKPRFCHYCGNGKPCDCGIERA